MQLEVYDLSGSLVLTGATLSRLAHGNYTALIAVATLNLSLATALLTSGFVFWKRRIVN